MKKVLIVDDDPLITRVYERHFRADGFEVRTAHSGQSGLDAVRAFRPDAVLLDLSMPDINGVEWLREIRGEAGFARLPVLVFTAGTLAWQVWAAANLDATLFFKEGAAPRDVVKAINSAIAVPALEQPLRVNP